MKTLNGTLEMISTFGLAQVRCGFPQAQAEAQGSPQYLHSESLVSLGSKSGFQLRPAIEVMIYFTYLNLLLLGEGQLWVTVEWSNPKLQEQVLKVSLVEESAQPLAVQPTGSGFVL